MTVPAPSQASARLSIAACALAIAGCGSGSQDSTSQPAIATPAPSPAVFLTSPVASNKVEGDVFSFQTGAIGGADINVLLERVGPGFAGYFFSDGAGHFVLRDIPDSRLWLLAKRDGFVQPCAVIAESNANTRVDIEMVTVASLDSINAPRPQLSSDPAVAGMVYEVTSTGRVPILDAEIHAQNVYADLASTRSDRRGGFYLCNLPTVFGLLLRKEGFIDAEFGPIDGSSAQAVEIGMKRR